MLYPCNGFSLPVPSAGALLCGVLEMAGVGVCASAVGVEVGGVCASAVGVGAAGIGVEAGGVSAGAVGEGRLFVGAAAGGVKSKTASCGASVLAGARSRSATIMNSIAQSTLMKIHFAFVIYYPMLCVRGIRQIPANVAASARRACPYCRDAGMSSSIAI